MDDQLDGRAVAGALRGLADSAPAPGDLSALLQQLVDTARTVLTADGMRESSGIWQLGSCRNGEQGDPGR